MRTALAGAALVAVVACGGGDPSPRASTSLPALPSPTGSPLTKQAWVAAANGVCRDFYAAAKAIGSNDDNSADEYVANVRKGLAAAEDASAGLRALVPPTADAAAIESNVYAYFDALAGGLREAMPAVEEAARKGDRDAAEAAAFAAMAGTRPTMRDSETFIEGYGLKDCL